MKSISKRQRAAIGLAFCFFVASCAIPAKSATERPEPKFVVFDEIPMEIHPESPRRSKKNADRIFDAWSEKTHIKRIVRGRRLMSILPREDGVHLTYTFLLPNAGEQRVELVVPDSRKTKESWR